MEYKTLTTQDKISGLNNRIRQLEEEHYGNSVFALEAELIGSESETLQFKAKNAGLELRINALIAERDNLSESIKDSEENDNTV